VNEPDHILSLLRPSPLKDLRRRTDLHPVQVADLLGLTPSQAQYLEDHTRLFVPEVWTIIEGYLLPSDRWRWRGRIRILNWVYEEDVILDRQADPERGDA
jgi:hypothetical protein